MHGIMFIVGQICKTHVAAILDLLFIFYFQLIIRKSHVIPHFWIFGGKIIHFWCYFVDLTNIIQNMVPMWSNITILTKMTPIVGIMQNIGPFDNVK